jgi:cation transport ATPase
MKTKILICLFFFALTMQVQSQERKSKSEQWLVLVNGNCEMCKARIEKAALRTKGVKYASWDMHSKTLKLIFNSYKTSKDTLAKSILAVGHDVDTLKAPDEQYQKLHFCCHYRE